MNRLLFLAAALLVLPACDSGGSDSDSDGGTTTADVQGQWTKASGSERIIISGSTFRGGDTSDLCFAETYRGTLSTGSDGALKITSESNVGTLSLVNNQLVVSGVTDPFSFNYNGTFSKSSGSLADC